MERELNMNILDVIEKKKNNQELSEDDINFFISGYVNNEIPDYQISSLLMAIRINDMTPNETSLLTKAIIESGDQIDLSSIEGFKVDKHSTGGIGDKVSLIVAPILAALNVPVAKMSGRGLGITGGTVDKLESVSGFHVELSIEDFVKQVNDHKIAIIGQSGNLVPADKKLYALRDVTGTVDSIPLIASSIMSKKIASGADGIVLDVKCGNGAFMKTPEDAKLLANTMIQIGKDLGRKVSAVITDMNQPIGYTIGNKLEVVEAYKFLREYTESEVGLSDVSIRVASLMYQLASNTSIEEAQNKVEEVLTNHKALRKFEEFITAQGGSISDIKKPTTKHKIPIISESEGYLYKLDAEKVGRASLMLGAGRKTKEDIIDYDAGVELTKSYAQKVEVGDVLCYLYTNKDDSQEAIALMKSSLVVLDRLPELPFSIISTLKHTEEM